MTISITDDYVGGGIIASSTSAVNYVDIPMSLFTSGFGSSSFNTQLQLRMNPTSSGPRLRMQLLDSGGSTTRYDYSIHYVYGNNRGASSAVYQDNVDIGILPVYNQNGFNGVNTLIRVNTPDSWVASKAPMIRIDTHFLYSSLITHIRSVFIPYYPQAVTAVATIRLFFDNTSSANVATYELRAGV